MTAGFAERVGGVLVRPRATLAHVAATGEGGARDVAVLVALKVLASNTESLARAVMAVPALGVSALLRGVVHALSTVVLDAAAIVIGSMVMKLFVAHRTGGRELDLAALAWVPYLAVTLAVGIVDTALRHSPGSVEASAVHLVALGWSGVIWALGLIALRDAKEVA